MKKFKLGWILFPRRDEPFWESLEAYSKMGYHGMEFGDRCLDMPGATPEENWKHFKDLGLEVVSVNANHFAKAYDEEAVDKVIERVKMTGASFAGCYVSSAINTLMGKEEEPFEVFAQEVENLEKAAERMAKAGAVLTYHNHYQEFRRVHNGVSFWDYMVANTKYLKFEPDCGWITYAGEDPIKVLDKLGDRVHAIHFKDFMPGRDVTEPSPMTGRDVTMPCFTSVGSGALDLIKCAEWAYNHDIEWCSIEQDKNNNLTSEESLQCAMFNVRETGFVESK